VLRRRDIHDTTRIETQLHVGSYVMVSYPAVGESNVPKKFNNIFKGPFNIIAVHSKHNYLTEDLNHPFKQQVVHVDRIKPIIERPERLKVSFAEPTATEIPVEPSITTTDTLPIRRSTRKTNKPARYSH
jgi:hypothetical protein